MAVAFYQFKYEGTDLLKNDERCENSDCIKEIEKYI
jgi:hypothetical protein